MTNNKTAKAIAYCALFFMNYALISSCSADDSEPADVNRPVAAQISAGIGESLTRAVDTKWTSTDNIGVMVTATTANSSMTTLYKNVQYKIKTLSNDNATAEFEAADQTKTSTVIFFQDKNETVTFSAYAPYQASDPNVLPGTGGAVTVNTKDNNGSTSDQEKIDFIYASGATASFKSPTAKFSDDNQFKHKMARLILKVQMSTADGFAATDVSKISNITLGGLVHEGTFNVATGATNTTGSAVSDWSLRSTADSKTTDNVAKTETNNVYTYTMILLPQKLESALSLDITVADGYNSQTYSNNSTIKPDLASGTSYEYTITVKKQGLTINGCVIAAWSSGTGGSGDATF